MHDITKWKKQDILFPMCKLLYLSVVSSNLFIVAQTVVISNGKCSLRHLCCKIKSTTMEPGGEEPEF